jgi:hypothetical protein
VHLILNAARELIHIFNGRVQILVGGQANMKDPYAAQCAWTMQGLSPHTSILSPLSLGMCVCV